MRGSFFLYEPPLSFSVPHSMCCRLFEAYNNVNVELVIYGLILHTNNDVEKKAENMQLCVLLQLGNKEGSLLTGEVKEAARVVDHFVV